MGKQNGTSTSRTPLELYRGYRIIRVIKVEYGVFGYEIRRDVHFDFCREGDEKKPSLAYEVWADNIPKCKACIDKFIQDDTLYFTHGEREKYVYTPNHKCHWAYGYNSLVKLMKEHQKADKRMKILLEDRLEDANFHTECSYLSKGDYKGFEEYVADTFRFREKFEIFTETMRRRIKEPKRLEKAIQDAINEVLKREGVKDTSVSVNLVENW